MAEALQFLSQARIAGELGVGRAAVSNWLRRYPTTVPEPAAYVDGYLPLWRPEQMGEWREFKRRRDMTYDELIENITLTKPAPE